MKITVKTANLSSEQMKCLSQVGRFLDENDETWEGSCFPEDFEESMEFLKRAGIKDVFVEFGE